MGVPRFEIDPYLIDRTSEDAYLKGFYRDLNKEGFEGSFQKNFGLSSKAMLEAFHQSFLPLSEEEKLKILLQNKSKDDLKM